jgi:hypothetical protein
MVMAPVAAPSTSPPGTGQWWLDQPDRCQFRHQARRRPVSCRRAASLSLFGQHVDTIHVTTVTCAKTHCANLSKLPLNRKVLAGKRQQVDSRLAGARLVLTPALTNCMESGHTHSNDC